MIYKFNLWLIMLNSCGLLLHVSPKFSNSYPGFHLMLMKFYPTRKCLEFHLMLMKFYPTRKCLEFYKLQVHCKSCVPCACRASFYLLKMKVTCGILPSYWFAYIIISKPFHILWDNKIVHCWHDICNVTIVPESSSYLTNHKE